MLYIIVATYLFIIGSSLLVSASPLFDSEEPVSIQIIAPLNSLKKQRGEDPQWLEGKVLLKGSDGVDKTLDIRLKARGSFRRKSSTCHFPPFWLNFKKQEVNGTIFEGLDKVKVVSHCRAN